MVNDEVNNKAINIEIKVAEYSAKAIKKIMEDAAEKSQPLADYLSEKRKTNSRKLKDMVKKGQLENINLQKSEVKEFKKELNRYGVNFSVMKNKVIISHHQAHLFAWMSLSISNWSPSIRTLGPLKKPRLVANVACMGI